MADPPESAVYAVFGTAELSEMIFSHLSLKSLTRALSVSKEWNAAVLSSPQLRRNLFLEPAPAETYLVWSGSDSVDARFYSQLFGPFPVLSNYTVKKARDEGDLLVAKAHPAVAACKKDYTMIVSNWHTK